MANKNNCWGCGKFINKNRLENHYLYDEVCRHSCEDCEENHLLGIIPYLMTKMVKESSFKKLIEEQYLLDTGCASEIYKKSIKKYIDNLTKAHEKEIEEINKELIKYQTLALELATKNNLLQKSQLF